MKKKLFKSALFPALMITLCAAGLIFFVTVILKANLMLSDPLWYWYDSDHIATPFNPFHVPGYPYVITLVRFITADVFAPPVVMIAITLSALIICVITLHKLLIQIGVNHVLAFWGALLFGLFPCVGLVGGIDMLADTPAIMWFLLGLHQMTKKHTILTGLFFGLAMIFHKILWIPCLMLFGYFLLGHKFTLKKDLPAILLLVLPIGVLWIAGAIHHQSLLWLISSSAQTGIDSRQSMPIFEGLYQTLLHSQGYRIFKTIIVYGLFLFSIFLMGWFYIKEKTHRYAGMILAFGVFFWFIILTEYEIWAPVRYSRILVIPLVILLNNIKPGLQFLWKKPLAYLIVFLPLLGSQFVFAWYTYAVFLAGR